MLIDTPCIGICSSVYGDAICRGCKRRAQEVIDWNRYTLTEKLAIYQRLQSQIAFVLEKYIDIIDTEVLQQKIIQLNIRLHPHATYAEQAFHLLRLGAQKINNLNAYGLAIKPGYADVALKILFNQIDGEVYGLASTAQ